MKQYIFKFSNWLIITFLFSSCEKVIEINLNSADPKIVVEAEISDQSFCKVKLTQTVNFDESNTFPAVTGAIVRVSDNSGNSEILTETAQGIYNGFNLAGISGKTYTLEITAEGKTYTAVSTMPLPVSIDALFIENTSKGHGPMGGGKSVSVQFKDPAGVNNYYRFIQIINNVEQNSIIIDADVLQDGNTIIRSLYSENNDSGLQTGDSVTVLLLTIDKGAFDYLRTFNQLNEGGGLSAASPANPLSNFSNTALGYFSANSVHSKTIVIQ
ncbi:MAG: DUF4249 domain-containing protein [Bacteroidetes bacterium]|nr:MAG: DUF4249 domain-containing protein [Bacteroidota bacterium]